MLSHRGIHCLPVEVMIRTFSYLDVRGLFVMAYVCSRWRSIAFHHPKYWARIIIPTVHKGMLARMQHRLEVGGKRLMQLFEVNYLGKHDQDDPVRKFLIPMLAAAVPRTRVLIIRVESMYRLHVEAALCQAAPDLQRLSLYYESGPVPELPYWLPLGYQKKLLAGDTGSLRTVNLWNVVLPSVVTAAFENVDEVWFMNAFTIKLEEFPCYLFEFFPKMTRLRMALYECDFTNAPLPQLFRDRFSRLSWFDFECRPARIPDFFEHLLLHDMADVTLGSSDEDAVYLFLKPLQSWFDLVLTETSAFQFLITVRSRHTPRVRRFAEAFRHYHEGTPYANALLDNDGFTEQLATFHIHASLWDRLKPWLVPSMDLLPKLILELNSDTPLNVPLPREPLPCLGLKTLVVQAKHDFAYIDAEELVAFADRLTPERVALELRRVFIAGKRDLVDARFSTIEYSIVRYVAE
ncbi:hypothetical protein AURDEDRAFT_167704 [Auricularia subglabra TFB-10046 SS5]|nr:hypothetical protein AURDEDRAFT_167704 [Auricularia subglabra TFB-10046 SS5]